MAKKPMKFKRYEGGGEVNAEVDPKESADKARGLKASKDDKVGFFERIRMGNIDDPSSAAYKRFGAGRGRTAAEEDAPKPQIVARPPAKPNPIFAAGEAQGKRQPSGDASVAEDYSGARTKPIVTTAEKKPAASKPAASKPASKPAEAKPKMEAVSKSSYDGPLRGMRSDMRSSGADKRGETDMSNYKPRRSSGSSSTDGRGETDMSKYVPRDSFAKNLRVQERAMREANAAPAGSEYTSTEDFMGMKDMASKSNYVNDEKMGGVRGGYKRGGAVKKMASGGSASKRADGIATKGKTRGKMC
jgi:hypothetical protein